MVKKISTILLFFLMFSLIQGCQSPTTVVFEENSLSKGMTRKDMKKVMRLKLLAAHNPFKGECYHEYYPQKKMEIIAGYAGVLRDIASSIEPVFYILENVTIPSHSTSFGSNECLHGNGTLETWVKGHYNALDYISKN